ncbi:inhibitor of apoptosis-promoting Bax1-domain-containing protein [Polychytrium aggregatum]|uniref:inhibitor of apoptosis-promoting Bax1-domain-containing protein n=1 Tax=Polychytrium aggregatum TaxID=110093 RepID=UPI0022FEF58A|nr:inhibitor of apoptosis-promoting Bax1-domain-containing protein [Polychytrium aggregatum]KAI9204887.1 inhibitor of apoptosis-promoting Bax1-domain-containing protein [Polychytrium aggregatum]
MSSAYTPIQSNDSPPRYSAFPALGGDPDSDLPDDFKYGATVEQSSASVRLDFVRKVYFILAGQLTLTTAVSLLFMLNSSIKSWVQTHSWLLWTSIILSFVVLIAMSIYRRSYPTNIFLLGAFTFAEAYLVGTVVTFYDSTIVLQAVILTAALFIGLTLFTIQSRIEFDFLAPFVWTGIWILIISGIVQAFVPFGSFLNFVLCVGGIVLFSAYIIYDTFQLFQRMSPEDYVVASVELYLDILNLFLRILQLLSSNRDSD